MVKLKNNHRKYSNWKLIFLKSKVDGAHIVGESFPSVSGNGLREHTSNNASNS